MGGFKNEAVNVTFESGVINIIIAHLIKCSRQMKTDCIDKNNPLKNHEDRISARLVAEYLNVEPNDFRYIFQWSENFNNKTDSYIGRTDITVISGDFFRNQQAYVIIECKRIDGGDELSKKYINDGISRFFCPAPKPKYSSYDKQNIMFGYVVQAIDIPDNADKIDKLQASILKDVTVTEFVLNQDDSQHYVYTCEYISEHIGKVELYHLFFDFADVICKDKK